MTEEPREVRTGEERDRSRRRHLVLAALREFDEPVALADLADEVAIRETDADLASISPDRVKRIYFALYHRHIPILVREGRIEYDQESDLVRATDGPSPDLE